MNNESIKNIKIITSNKIKQELFKRALLEINIPKEYDIKIISSEYFEDELLGTTEKIVLDSAKRLTLSVLGNIVVQDTWLYIEALSWWPWVKLKYALKSVWSNWILNLMQWKINRECERHFSLWYCEPNKKPISFNYIYKWNISNARDWDNDNSFDGIFIPNDSLSTLAQPENNNKVLTPYKETIQQLLKHLSNQ